MRLHLEFAIRWLFLFLVQASLTTSDDMCSSTFYSSSSDRNRPSLSLTITDDNILPNNCSCEMTDSATFACSFYTNCVPCIPVLDIACATIPCPCAKVVYLTISPTCISTSIRSTSVNNVCPPMSNEAHSCQTLTTFRLIFSTDLEISSCKAKRNNNKGLVVTIQHITIEGEGDGDTSDHMFTEGQCTAITATPNASSTTLTPATSISSSVVTTAKIEYQSSFESTPKPETTSRPSPTFVSGSIIKNMTTEPFQNPIMMSDNSEKNIGIGVGVGVGVGILLIIAIIIIILIFRRRRAESQKLRANDATQPTVVVAAAAAPSETSYESYRVPVLAPYDNATNGVTASGYQTITYDSEPVGESNDGYTEIKEPEAASDHNGYDECRIGRNEVYSMYHDMGKDADNVSDNPSMNSETETTVIDNDLYG